MPAKKSTTNSTKKTTTAKKTTAKKSPATIAATRTTPTQTVKAAHKKSTGSSNGFHMIMLLLLVLTTVFTAINLGKNKATEWSVSKETIIEAMREIEQEKVWGAENYELVQELYSSEKFMNEQKTYLQRTIDQLSGQPSAPSQPSADQQQPTQPTAAPTKTITDDQLSAILKGRPVKGNNKATIAFIEYSDIECPFCKRLHDAGTIDQILSNYNDDVRYMFNHFPLSFHPNAQKAAEAAECVADLKGSTAYFDFVDNLFASGNPSPENATVIAKELGVNEDDMKECLSSNKFAAAVQQQMSDGQSIFGVTGTPGNVLINTETGEYEVVSGAQPYSAFEAAIKRLLN